MCLSSVYATNTRKRTGYKVVGRYNGQLEPQFRGGVFVRGDWTVDTRTNPISTIILNLPAYPAGFHVFLTLEGAQCWRGAYGNEVIAKVRFRQVVATGQQGSCGDVAVAREIYFPKRIHNYANKR